MLTLRMCRRVLRIEYSRLFRGMLSFSPQLIPCALCSQVCSGVVAEKESKDLFVLDVAGDSKISKNLPKKTKALRSDEIINQRSAVPAVSSKKRATDGVTDGVLPEKRQRKEYVSQKELVRLRKVADGRHEQTVTITEASYDPWTVSAEAKKEVTVTTEERFIPDPVTKPKVKAPKTLVEPPVSLLASGKQIPAVQKPKGGYSYNPAFTDYESRLTEEAAKVVEAERKRLAGEEAERLKLEAAARSAKEAEAAEARADMSEWDEDSAWEGFESEGEGLKINAKRPERKTQAQRNRIKRRKEEEQRKKHEEAMKRKQQQLLKIEELADEVYERERARELAKVEMSDDDSDVNDEELRRRQLGKFKLPEKDLELVLPDELQDSLRLLKPEGNLLKERYRSLLVRGKLESRRKIPYRKQARRKVTEKWTHKDFSLD